MKTFLLMFHTIHFLFLFLNLFFSHWENQIGYCKWVNTDKMSKIQLRYLQCQKWEPLSVSYFCISTTSSAKLPVLATVGWESRPDFLVYFFQCTFNIIWLDGGLKIPILDRELVLMRHFFGYWGYGSNSPVGCVFLYVALCISHTLPHLGVFNLSSVQLSPSLFHIIQDQKI